MKTDYIVVLITAPSREVGEQIARALLDGRLAACVNIVSAIDSLYWWQGELQSDQEVLLIAKSRADLFENGIIPTVHAVHPYEVPEIIALPILMGSRGYLDWIDKEITNSK
jgi:periplasmic divalent cation tolerance protein